MWTLLLILRTGSSLSPLGFLYFKVTQIPQKNRIPFFELLGNCKGAGGLGPGYRPTAATCAVGISAGREHRVTKMLLFVSGDVMGSSAILRSHAGKSTRSKFPGEEARESSRVLQVLSAEDSRCVRTGRQHLRLHLFITVSSSKVHTYA